MKSRINEVSSNSAPEADKHKFKIPPKRQLIKPFGQTIEKEKPFHSSSQARVIDEILEEGVVPQVVQFMSTAVCEKPEEKREEKDVGKKAQENNSSTKMLLTSLSQTNLSPDELKQLRNFSVTTPTAASAFTKDIRDGKVTTFTSYRESKTLTISAADYFEAGYKKPVISLDKLQHQGPVIQATVLCERLKGIKRPSYDQEQEQEEEFYQEAAKYRKERKTILNQLAAEQIDLTHIRTFGKK